MQFYKHSLSITKGIEVAEVWLLNQLWHCRISDEEMHSSMYLTLGQSFNHASAHYSGSGTVWAAVKMLN